MGSGCCSGGNCGGASAAPVHADVPATSALPLTEEAPPVGGEKGGEEEVMATSCDIGDDCCDDETCYEEGEDNESSAGASLSMATIECCNSNEERCDEKCIIAVAAAECEKACDDDEAHDGAKDHQHVHDKDGHHTGSACNTHLSKAFEQYSAYLETARCICRSILERGLPGTTSCCGDHQKQQKMEEEKAKRAAAKVAAAKKQKAKAAAGGDAHHHHHHHGRVHDHGGQHEHDEPAEADTTAHGLHKHSIKAGHHHHGMKHRKNVAANPGGAAPTVAGAPAVTATAAGLIVGASLQESDDDDQRIMAITPALKLKADYESDCCGDHHDNDSHHDNEKHQHHDKHGPAVAVGRVPMYDVEKGVGLELVSLIVEGMTCSGCANKLERALLMNSGVSGVHINFVMGSAEFSLDPAAASAVSANKKSNATAAEDAIRAAERATGFRIARVVSENPGDQTLDLVAASPRAAKAIIADMSIVGVSLVSLLDEKNKTLSKMIPKKGSSKNNTVTIRVTYDPTVIGARDLMGQIGRDGLIVPGNGGLAPPRDDPAIASGRRRLYDQLLKTAVAAALTIPVLVLTWGADAVHVQDMTRAAASLALATLVQLVAVPEFYQPALSALFRAGTVEMDMLVVISISAAYGYSVVAFGFRAAGRPLETAEFFETSTLLVTLVLLGRLVAAFARIRAVAAVSVRSLQASTALLIQQKTPPTPKKCGGGAGGCCGSSNNAAAELLETTLIDARLLQHGDSFKVLPHSTVPTDGVVVSGASEVDESMLTGESAPVGKQAGDALVAGTMNLSGTLVVRLTRLPGRNTVADIAKMVEDAARSKPRIQDVADRVASWFAPVVTAVAVLVVVVWVAVGLRGRGYDAGRAVPDAITYAIAVLAVSCPCALGLAVPMVLVVAGGIAARGGVVIKSAECTERARKVSHVVFDKTGTITEPDLDVVEEIYPDSAAGLDRNEAVALARALAGGNTHPVSVTVSNYLDSRQVSTEKATSAALDDIRVVPGSGVEAIYNKTSSQIVRAGNPQWTATTAHPDVARLQSAGLTLLVVTLASSSSPIAIFALRARLRPEAASVVARLQRRGIAVHLVSGDQRVAVESVARQVGIPLENVAAQNTPAQKREYVASLMAQGPAVQPKTRLDGYRQRMMMMSSSSSAAKKKAVVMFVGDGTNDAVAVAQADVGVQLAGASARSSSSSSGRKSSSGGGGASSASASAASDITRGAADVVLLSGLSGVTFLLDVSAAAFRRMAFNFAWSAVYNVLACLLAAGAFVTVRIPPAYAGLGELVSVLPVILAASTMLLVKVRADEALD